MDDTPITHILMERHTPIVNNLVSLTDRYNYTPVTLWKEEIQYCNVPQMDRVRT